MTGQWLIRWMPGIRRFASLRQTEVSTEGRDDNTKVPTFARVEAVHPAWHGFLRLSATDDSVLHEHHQDKGRYELAGQTLTVYWDNYGPDVFEERSGLFIHKSLMDKTPELEKLHLVRVDLRRLVATRLSVLVPGGDHEIGLRLRTSDILRAIALRKSE
jgi:hypothetical protein